MGEKSTPQLEPTEEMEFSFQQQPPNENQDALTAPSSTNENQDHDIDPPRTLAEIQNQPDVVPPSAMNPDDGTGSNAQSD